MICMRQGCMEQILRSSQLKVHSNDIAAVNESLELLGALKNTLTYWGTATDICNKAARPRGGGYEQRHSSVERANSFDYAWMEGLIWHDHVGSVCVKGPGVGFFGFCIHKISQQKRNSGQCWLQTCEHNNLFSGILNFWHDLSLALHAQKKVFQLGRNIITQLALET
ncbi:hypothetical protein J6590_035381 [Homalodisca vitripennis]|nr:hypothetical protein J6590_035381 [Homalodisca vitripennis]